VGSCVCVNDCLIGNFLLSVLFKEFLKSVIILFGEVYGVFFVDSQCTVQNTMTLDQRVSDNHATRRQYATLEDIMCSPHELFKLVKIYKYLSVDHFVHLWQLH